MYEELLIGLRGHAKRYGCDDRCPCYDAEDRGYTTCSEELAEKAADAIEELSMKLHGDEAAIVGMKREIERMVVAGKPRWIPVTERLPKDGIFVLVCNDDGHMMIAKHEAETYEWYYKYTNYDFDIWDNEEQGPVRYWMPIPEPPKEESDG